MKKQAGFVLLITTIILWVSAVLVMSTLDAFVLYKQVTDAYYKKIQNFYSAEAGILQILHSIELGENNSSAQLLKTDRCKNRYYQIHSKNSEIQAEYIIFNQNPPSGCIKAHKQYQRLWWLG